MPFERALERPHGSIPNADQPIIAAGCQPTSIGGKGEACNLWRMSGQYEFLGARFHICHPYPPLLGAPGQPLALWRDRDRGYRLGAGMKAKLRVVFVSQPPQ